MSKPLTAAAVARLRPAKDRLEFSMRAAWGSIS